MERQQDKLMRLLPETSTHTIGSGPTIPERPEQGEAGDENGDARLATTSNIEKRSLK
jgi:hypothetical protein